MSRHKVRLIDAIALEEDMRAYADNKAYCGHIELANGILKAVGRIDLAPTIYPESLRPKGRWIGRKEIFSEYEGEVDAIGCSECGKSQQKYRRTNFCPNCGAKMEGVMDG